MRLDVTRHDVVFGAKPEGFGKEVYHVPMRYFCVALRCSVAVSEKLPWIYIIKCISDHETQSSVCMNSKRQFFEK